jgi:hypothetical protein
MPGPGPAAFLRTPGTRDDKQLRVDFVARCPPAGNRDAGGGVDLTVTVVATMAATSTSKYLTPVLRVSASGYLSPSRSGSRNGRPPPFAATSKQLELAEEASNPNPSIAMTRSLRRASTGT